jgi:DNA polymerase
MLRELELLPVWRLRKQPVENVVAQAEAPEPSISDFNVLESVSTNVLPSATSSQEQHDAIMQMDWQAMQEFASRYEASGISNIHHQAAFGMGDPAADWLLVCEMPLAKNDGQDNAAQPFTGQEGELLDNMLAAIQLKRGQNVYIAGVLKNPSENREAQGEAAESQAAQCNPFLERQVELIKPRLIIAFGEVAAQSMLDSKASIAALRGKQHDYHGVPVIVTYHPADLLRNLPDKAKAWEDLCFARATMQALQSHLPLTEKTQSGEVTSN